MSSLKRREGNQNWGTVNSGATEAVQWMQGQTANSDTGHPHARRLKQKMLNVGAARLPPSNTSFQRIGMDFRAYSLPTLVLTYLYR